MRTLVPRSRCGHQLAQRGRLSTRGKARERHRRSAPVEVLKANGYTRKQLAANIDDAADGGVITPSRTQRAHDDIRVLGNEIVHDEWREVDGKEVTAALHDAQRVVEDFYDDQPTVEALPSVKGRTPAPAVAVS